MTPGYVNGVRIVWPEIRKIEPEVKPCIYGHTEGRNKSGRCIACAEVTRLKYVAKKRGEQ